MLREPEDCRAATFSRHIYRHMGSCDHTRKQGREVDISRGIVEAHTVHRSLAGGETVLSGACYAICEWSRTGSPKDEREERKEIFNRHAASLRGTFRTSA